MVRGGLGAWLGWARDPEQMLRVALLARSPLFADLPRRLLGRLNTRFFEKSYSPGELVFREGDPGKALFVVLEGEITIVRIGDEGEHVLRALQAGACFGELALIDEFPRSATARVSAPSRLLILYKSDFDALVEGNDRIALAVLRNLLRALTAYTRRASASGAAPASLARPDGDGRGERA
jgi:CRP/FNR family cyclic AMP-dependent transcriptional regulator